MKRCQRCENVVDITTYVSLPPHDRDPQMFCFDCALDYATEHMPKKKKIRVGFVRIKPKEQQQ